MITVVQVSHTCLFCRFVRFFSFRLCVCSFFLLVVFIFNLLFYIFYKSLFVFLRENNVTEVTVSLTSQTGQISDLGSSLSYVTQVYRYGERGTRCDRVLQYDVNEIFCHWGVWTSGCVVWVVEWDILIGVYHNLVFGSSTQRGLEVCDLYSTKDTEFGLRS